MTKNDVNRIKEEMSKAVIDFSDVSMTREEMNVFMTGWDKCLMELDNVLDNMRFEEQQYD